MLKFIADWMVVLIDSIVLVQVREHAWVPGYPVPARSFEESVPCFNA